MERVSDGNSHRETESITRERQGVMLLRDAARC